MSRTDAVDKMDLIEKENGENNDNYGSISDATPETSDEKKLLTKQLVLLVIISVMGGFLFGYDTGIVSGAMLSLKVKFHLDYLWQELIISVTVAAAAVSAVAAGPLSDWIGRKPVILTSSFLYATGAAVMAFISRKELLLTGRLIIGIGVGLTSVTVPIYISESSPKHYRGNFTAGFNLMIACGQAIAAIVAGLFFPNKMNGWRYMLGLAGIPGLIQLIGFLFMPESPRYLVAKGKEEQAKQVLTRLRPSGFDVSKEIEDIQLGHMKAMKDADSQGSKLDIFIKMVRHGPTRRALLIGGGLQMFQQLIGINTVLYYMATIIQMGGIRNSLTAVFVAAGIAVINAIGAFIGTLFVESFGRRRLTLLSLFGVLLSLIFLGIGFQVMSSTSPLIESRFTPPTGLSGTDCAEQSSCSSCVIHQDCGFCYSPPKSSHLLTANASCLPTTIGYGTHSLYGPCQEMRNNTSHRWTYMFCPTHYSWMAIVGILSYIITFSVGMGPMPWTVNAEIYPTWARSTGASFSTAMNWGFNLLISMTFLSLTIVITKAGTFWLYAIIALIGLIYFYIFLPETKGKSLEEMEEVFSRPWDCQSCHK